MIQKFFQFLIIIHNYTWILTKCTTFWKELLSFAFPKTKEKESALLEKQFLLGFIMSFTNEDGITQIIFGQDKFITIILLLTALRENLKFYEHFGDAKLQNTCSTIDRLIRGLNNCVF